MIENRRRAINTIRRARNIKRSTRNITVHHAVRTVKRVLLASTNTEMSAMKMKGGMEEEKKFLTDIEEMTIEIRTHALGWSSHQEGKNFNNLQLHMKDTLSFRLDQETEEGQVSQMTTLLHKIVPRLASSSSRMTRLLSAAAFLTYVCQFTFPFNNKHNHLL